MFRRIRNIVPQRAPDRRPYIHDGKCCDAAGKQWEFVMLACREAKRLPYDIHGRSCGFAGEWCRCARFCRTPHQSPSVTASPQGEAKGRCRASAVEKGAVFCGRALNERPYMIHGTSYHNLTFIPRERIGWARIEKCRLARHEVASGRCPLNWNLKYAARKKPTAEAVGFYVCEVRQERLRDTSEAYISKGSMPRTGWPFSDR